MAWMDTSKAQVGPESRALPLSCPFCLFCQPASRLTEDSPAYPPCSKCSCRAVPCSAVQRGQQ